MVVDNLKSGFSRLAAKLKDFCKRVVNQLGAKLQLRPIVKR